MQIQVTLTVDVEHPIWTAFEEGDDGAYEDVASRFMEEVMSMNLEPTIAVDPFTADELQILIHAMEYRAQAGWSMHDKNTGRIAMYRSALQKLYKRQAVQ